MKTLLCTLFIIHVKIIMCIKNFCGLLCPQKVFNNEIIPDYDVAQVDILISNNQMLQISIIL